LHTTVVCDGAVEGLCSYARAGAGLQGLSRHRLLTGEGECRTHTVEWMWNVHAKELWSKVFLN